VQEDKEKKLWTELDGSEKRETLNINHTPPLCKKTRETCSGQSSMWGYLESRPKTMYMKPRKKSCGTEFDGP
jgi:hypothetical protein